jgi:hypothetical protein
MKVLVLYLISFFVLGFSVQSYAANPDIWPLDAIDFGYLKIGESAFPRYIQIENASTKESVKQLKWAADLQNQATIKSTCPDELLPLHSCFITLDFKPTKTEPFSSHVDISWASGSRIINVYGQGTN